MIPADIPPVCVVPGCQHGAQIYSKVGDHTSYLKTCRRHWLGQVPEKDKPPANK